MSKNDIVTTNDIRRALGQPVILPKRMKVPVKDECLAPRQVKSVAEAVKLLGESTKKQYVIRSYNKRIEVYDNEGNYVDGGSKPDLLAARLSLLSYGEAIELAEGQ